MEFDPCQAWYHGSPNKLSVLRKGSTITQKRELARIFSHKPTIVSVDDDGRIKHNGTVPGYLYVLVEIVEPEDVVPHPYSTMQEGDEWVTDREFQVQLMGTTEVVPSELLSDEELTELLRRTGPHL